MKLTKRQKDILTAIIEEHVKAAEAVGSETIGKVLPYKVSPATVRNEMAILEELGLIMKEYSSSGRIPSDKGYREYIESLKLMPTSNSFPLIDQIFKRNFVSREKSLQEAMMLISELTHYASLIFKQNKQDIKVKKLAAVELNSRLAVLIMVTEQGYVENRKVILPETISFSELSDAVLFLDETLSGTSLKNFKGAVEEKLHTLKKPSIFEELVNSLLIAFAEMAKDEFFVFGSSHFLVHKEFSDHEKAKKIVEALSHDEVIKICLKDTNDLKVKIGEDNSLAEFKDCSIVSIPYYDDIGAKGVIAVVGPKRMDYKIIIAMLIHIANNLKKEDEKEWKIPKMLENKM